MKVMFAVLVLSLAGSLANADQFLKGVGMDSNSKPCKMSLTVGTGALCDITVAEIGNFRSTVLADFVDCSQQFPGGVAAQKNMVINVNVGSTTSEGGPQVSGTVSIVNGALNAISFTTTSSIYGNGAQDCQAY